MKVFDRFSREISVAGGYLCLLLALGIYHPDFYSTSQFRETWINCAPILIAGIGMTLVIIAREIDISIGSQFSVCAVTAGLAAKAGAPIPVAGLAAVGAGMLMGALNGVLIAFAGLPSIVVTLGTMVILRYSLMYALQGALVRGIPQGFQWFGFGQKIGSWMVVGIAIGLLVIFTLIGRYFAAGRSVYAVGADREAARLAGMRPRLVLFNVFVLMGALMGVAALLSAIRLPQVDPNSGTGKELQVIAAVVVGGVAISGGRGTFFGTLIGVILLITVAPALVFFKIPSMWERAVQGGIILAAVAYDGLLRKEGA